MYMARMGKKTLYLDLDQIEQIEQSLQDLPGKPSFSAFLSDNLALIQKEADRLVTLLKPSQDQKENDHG